VRLVVIEPCQNLLRLRFSEEEGRRGGKKIVKVMKRETMLPPAGK
jgi:hypothetical protein